MIDEEAAAVVRRIFQLTIEGKGPYDIARILSQPPASDAESDLSWK